MTHIGRYALCGWILCNGLVWARPADTALDPPPAQPSAPAPENVAVAVAWTALSADEQRALSAFADEWSQLAPEAQQRLRRGAQRWLGMDRAERVDAAERFAHWQQMDQERRERIRQRFEAFRQLPPAQQRELRRAFEQFRALPPWRREELLRRFAAMGPAEREAFLLALRARSEAQRQEGFGAGQGRGPGPGQRAWDFVPPEERAQTIAMMRSLSPAERHAVRLRVEGMDAAQKDALRRQLLPLSPAERRRFLLGTD